MNIHDPAFEHLMYPRHRIQRFAVDLTKCFQAIANRFLHHIVGFDAAFQQITHLARSGGQQLSAISLHQFCQSILITCPNPANQILVFTSPGDSSAC
jgi:hypothetical protein